MQENVSRRESYPSRAMEYQALRQFIRLSEKNRADTVAAKMTTAVLYELTPRQREMVEMYYIDQRRMQDVADELGVSISCVSRTLKRARTRLKRCLRYGGRALLDSIES